MTDGLSTSESGDDSGSSTGGTTTTDGGTSGGTQGDDTGDPGDTETTGDEIPLDCEEVPLGNQQRSLIWIANSTEGTVSRIDTETMEELGRYYTRDDGAGWPSRTSVALDGDVAIANRAGGVTKIYADPSRCEESNGIPGIQTSTGGGDLLSWGEDECIAWHTPLEGNDNRPIAWTKGVYNPETCQYEGAKVWTAASSMAVGTIRVYLLDGDTGAIEAEKLLSDVYPIPPYNYGGYGGAVDAEDSFWFSQLGQGKLVKVSYDGDTLEHQTWNMPHVGYGMTLGPSGYIWTCSHTVSRFDPKTETWSARKLAGPAHSGGCVEFDGIIYKAHNDGIAGLDIDSLDVVAGAWGHAPPQAFWGLSIDFQGRLWAVPRMGTTAYRIDLESNEAEIFDGLVGAYTYSDMTGYALNSVISE